MDNQKEGGTDMEKKTMGSFMAALRKANGLTQQQVADILNVSNKTVSKWERDDGCPEITMLPAIAEIYSVTVDELLRGERKIKDENEDSANDSKAKKQLAQVQYLFSAATEKYTILSAVSIIISVASIFLMMFVNSSVYFVSLMGTFIYIIMISSATICELVGTIKYDTILRQSTIQIEEEKLIKGKKSIRIYSTLGFAIILAQVVLLILSNLYYLGMIITAVVTFVASFILYCSITKRYSLDEKADERYLSFKKKVVKVIVILIIITLVICTIIAPIQIIGGGPVPDVLSIHAIAICLTSIGLIMIGTIVVGVAKLVIAKSKKK